MMKIFKRIFKKRKAIDYIAMCLGGFAFIAYISYFIKLILWWETLQAMIICLVVMALTLCPLVFHKKLAEKLPKKLFTVLKGIYLAAGAFYMATFLAMCIYIANVNSHQAVPEDLDSETVFIVYGAGLQGEKPGRTLQKRLNKTLELYENCPDAYIVVTGGQGENEVRTEASAMKEYLLERGIREERILLEDKARDTKQNIVYSLELIEKAGIESYTKVSVSNAFHIPRIILLWDMYGETSEIALAEDPQLQYIFATLVREYMSYVKLILLGSE